MLNLPAANLLVSFAISTHNRRTVLLRTLAQVRACGLSRDAFEIIVVDNASSDGTTTSISRLYPDITVIALKENRGSCAKNLAVEQARGRYIVFLDDDSFPEPGTVARMIRHFDADPTLGAAVFTVTLPDGSRECSAYPDVFIGCGTGFRRRALTEVGGLPDSFFMQAEEYDLSLRLMEAGWDVRSFDDLFVTHLKTPNARRSWRTMRLDVRNNLVVATKYVPQPWVGPIAKDWMKRYYRIAKVRKQRMAFFTGLVQGAFRSASVEHHSPVKVEVFERFARVGEIRKRMAEHVEALGIRSVLFIDYGKNILPYWNAALSCGIEVVAIADEKLARSGTYQGVPIVNDAVARRLDFDAAIVSNMSPVHASARLSRWRALDHRPIIDLFERGAQEAAPEPARFVIEPYPRLGLAA